MIAARTPRILFPSNRHVAEPRLPKYVPLTKVDGYWALKFEIPVQGSIPSQSLPTQMAAQDTISLHTFTYQPLAFTALSESSLCLPTPLDPHPSANEPTMAASGHGAVVLSDTCAGVVLHGGAHVQVDWDVDAYFLLNDAQAVIHVNTPSLPVAHGRLGVSCPILPPLDLLPNIGHLISPQLHRDAPRTRTNAGQLFDDSICLRDQRRAARECRCLPLPELVANGGAVAVVSAVVDDLLHGGAVSVVAGDLLHASGCVDASVDVPDASDSVGTSVGIVEVVSLGDAVADSFSFPNGIETLSLAAMEVAVYKLQHQFCPLSPGPGLLSSSFDPDLFLPSPIAHHVSAS